MMSPRTDTALLVLALSSACTRAPEPVVEPAPEPPPPFVAPTCDRVPPEPPPFRVPYHSDEKWGLADREGVLVAKPIYDDIRTTEWSHFLVRRGDRWGVIDTEGNELISLEWRSIRAWSATHVAVYDDQDRAQLRDLCNQVALPGYYDNISPGGPVHVVERDGQWGLLDHRALLVGDWSDTRLAHGYGIITQHADDRRVHVLHEDGRPWVSNVDASLFIVRIWPEHEALLTLSYDDDAPRACLYASSGQPLVPCNAYRELLPVSQVPPLLWANTGSGWGLIEIAEANEPRVIIDHRYPVRTTDGLVDEVERIVVDVNGQVIERRPASELERGPLPKPCRGLTSWRRVHDEVGNVVLEYLDADGNVVERSQRGHTPNAGTRIVVRGKRWGAQDVCSQQWIVPLDYQRLTACGATHILAFSRDRMDIYDIDQTQRIAGNIDAQWAKCERDRIFTSKSTTEHGMLDLEGRELLPPVFHEIDTHHRDGSPLIRLRWFNLWVYASIDGVRYFDEPLPEPTEVPGLRSPRAASLAWPRTPPESATRHRARP